MKEFATMTEYVMYSFGVSHGKESRRLRDKFMAGWTDGWDIPSLQASVALGKTKALQREVAEQMGGQAAVDAYDAGVQHGFQGEEEVSMS